MAKISPSKVAELEREFEGFLSAHTRGTEEYQFNIKMHFIDVPEIARQLIPADELDRTIGLNQTSRLMNLKNDLHAAYPWILKIQQEGRSGGWLILWPRGSVLDEDLTIKANFTVAEKRLKDLFEIKALVKQRIAELKEDFNNPAWWGYGPRDWMPTKKKPTMGGIFDVFRKKKEPEKGGLIRVHPVEILPPTGGGLIPAGPPSPGTFANPFDLLAPPGREPGMVLYAPPAAPAFFDVQSPPGPRMPETTPAWDVLAPAPPAVVPAPRGRTAGRRPSWMLPTPEEFASRLRATLDLGRIFSQIRATRKGAEFQRDLRRFGTRGLPALLPIMPVADQDLEADFARFFGIPGDVLDTYEHRGTMDSAIWDQLFWPLFDILGEAFEIEKPEDLPGWFALEPDAESDEWWLAYLEAE